jgi:serine/threonine-protein phosphatase 2B catalytic subunit
LRGNHECRQMTAFFNFRIEVLTKYDEETYNLFMDTFDVLPIGWLVNSKFLAIHGGISPDLKTLDDLNNIKRAKEPPRTGLFWDILWSDPVEDDSGYCESLYKTNEVRGCSFFFGSDAASKFLRKNRLLSIIRAHEAQLEGYKMHKWNAKSGFPVVITIFSAPNYWDVYNNKGAIIKFKGAEINIQQFNYTPHPYILPNFMDVFSWSMPFVIEKVTEMLYNVLKYDGALEEDEKKDLTVDKVKDKLNEEAKETQKMRIQSLKNKIRSIGKMAMIFRTLREEHENITKLKGLCPGYKIPPGILSGGAGAIEEAVAQFEKAKKMDRVNEGMPEEMKTSTKYDEDY